jgi:hypothetical protein
MPSALSGPTYTDVRFYYGDDQIPRDVVNLRQSTMEAMRRLGTPVLIKRMYTAEDVDLGQAQPSPAQDVIYKQSRHNDPLSYGVGFCSIDTQPGEWYDPVTFEVVVTDVSGQSPVVTPDFENFEEPRTNLLPAPRYRGYGPGFLTYVILPDRPEDVFKLTPQGAMIRTQTAKLQLPWWPLVGDNDLMIAVELDNAGNITETFERYQLKQVMPITMRGEDRSGRREISHANVGGNRYWVGQECEAVKVMPLSDPIYSVETDR